nr:helix-turn-helix domain-containing protein [Lujinxingiaceae bacterium]
MTVRLLLPRTDLSPDVVEELLRGARAGVDYDVLARNVGCVLSTVYRVLGARGDRPVDRRAAVRLTLGEREEIRVALVAGASLRAIARRIARHPGTIAREVAKNGGRDQYRAYRAD